MIQSSLSSFASQLKANSGSNGDSSQDQVQEISRDPEQGLEQDQVDRVDSPEEEGELESLLIPSRPPPAEKNSRGSSICVCSQGP